MGIQRRRPPRKIGSGRVAGHPPGAADLWCLDASGSFMSPLPAAVEEGELSGAIPLAPSVEGIGTLRKAPLAPSVGEGKVGIDWESIVWENQITLNNKLTTLSATKFSGLFSLFVETYIYEVFFT
jgi:hypothetical protein